jgi:hypothetical protein
VVSQLQAHPDLGAFIRSILVRYDGAFDEDLRTVLSLAPDLEKFHTVASTSSVFFGLLARTAGSSLRELTFAFRNDTISTSAFSSLTTLRVLEIYAYSLTVTPGSTLTSQLNQLHTLILRNDNRSLLDAFSMMRHVSPTA